MTFYGKINGGNIRIGVEKAWERLRLGGEIINGEKEIKGVSAVIDSEGFEGGEFECGIEEIAPDGRFWAEFLLDIDEYAEEGKRSALPLEIRGEGYSVKRTIDLWISYRGSGEPDDTAALQNEACRAGLYGELSEDIGSMKWKRRF